jgi:hypothetical protein
MNEDTITFVSISRPTANRELLPENLGLYSINDPAEYRLGDEI